MDAERSAKNDAERQLTMTKAALDEADQGLGVMTTAKNTAHQQLKQMPVTRKSEAELLAKDYPLQQLAGMTAQMAPAQTVSATLVPGTCDPSTWYLRP